MTRNQQLKILNNPKASKEQLRQTLADALGVSYERKTKEKAVTPFTQCRDVFMEAYKKHTGLDYSFGTKDGVALSHIVEKLKGIVHELHTDEMIISTWRLLLLKLPDWYKKNAFSLTVINSKFNEIVASIKNGGKQGITDDYKARILNDLTT